MIIYKTTNLLNGKFYIGKDFYNNPNYLGSGVLLKKAIKKYRRENFTKEILQTCTSRQELNLAEQEWIKKLDARNLNIAYNIALGGDGKIAGSSVSDETKRKISKGNLIEGFIEKYGLELGTQKYNDKINRQRIAQIKRFSNPEEKKKITEANSGSNNGMFNKKHSEETKEKIRQKKLGKKASPETIALFKQIMKGKNNHKPGIFKGSQNPNAKQWKLINPNGKEHLITGDLENFAKENELSISCLRRFKNQIVPPPKRLIKHTKNSHYSKINTIGWSIFEM